MRASVYIATSLDGYIADKNGNLDWLDEAAKSVPDGEDLGYNNFMESIDHLVMGRNTFEKVLSFGKWPYKKPVIVLSRKKIEDLPDNVSCSSEPPKVLYDRLASKGANRLYIDGGITIQRFLSAGLIDDLIITLIPVFLGSGIPLFSGMEKEINLKLINNLFFDFGFVQLTYEIQTDS